MKDLIADDLFWTNNQNFQIFFVDVFDCKKLLRFFIEISKGIKRWWWCNAPCHKAAVHVYYRSPLDRSVGFKKKTYNGNFKIEKIRLDNLLKILIRRELINSMPWRMDAVFFFKVKRIQQDINVF